MVRGADWFDEELLSLGHDAKRARGALLAFKKTSAIPRDLPKMVKMAFAAR